MTRYPETEMLCSPPRPVFSAPQPHLDLVAVVSAPRLVRGGGVWVRVLAAVEVVAVVAVAAGHGALEARPADNRDPCSRAITLSPVAPNRYYETSLTLFLPTEDIEEIANKI